MQPENWLIPAGCIEAEPPESKQGQAAKWQPEKQAWQYLPDYRGQTAYHTQTRQPETVDTIGELPAHLTIAAPPSELHQWNGKVWVVDKAKQAAAEKTAFQAAQSAKLTELANAAQAFVDKHAKTDIVPAFEQETWAMQGAEARAWADDDNAPTPILDSIARHRNIDRIMLIRAALHLGALPAADYAAHATTLDDLGEHLGIAYQITDDILDATADSATLGKTAGKDAAQGKNPSPALLGLDASRAALAQHSAQAEAAAARLPHGAPRLRALLARITHRSH